MLTPPPEMTCGFLIQLVFCEKKTMWFIGVEVEQGTSAPPPKKNPGSAPAAPYGEKSSCKTFYVNNRDLVSKTKMTTGRAEAYMVLLGV